MGMIATLVALPSEKVESLQADPDLLEEYFFEQLEEQDDQQDHILDIDKAWHGIHFLLTGETFGGEEPAALVILGGTEIGENGIRLLTAEDVTAIADFLKTSAIESLRQKYDPSAFEAADIYPTGIWEEEGIEAFEYLAHYYTALQEFYKNAANNQHAVLVFIG